jgi:hypothetical protein
MRTEEGGGMKPTRLWDRLILWQYGRRNRLWCPDDTRFRDFASGFLPLDSLLDESAS